MISSWWNEREPREQWLLGTAAILTVLMLLWAGVLSPAMDYRRNQETALRSALAENAEIRAGVARVGDARVAAMDEQPLQSVIMTSAAASGVTLNRLTPAENDGFNLWIDAASPDALYGWLVGLETRHGVRVGKASLRLNSDEATVGASLYLVRGN